ncbi:MAG TPA: 3-dehydroquinate synthase [Williamwhitmania sp.]|nr:3-dehydroquinate synthase [Williamwhitmania sp.]
MKKINVQGQHSSSTILVGESLLKLKEYIPEENTFIITDKNVYQLYQSHFPRMPLFIIEPGEESKSLKVAEEIYRWLLQENADRKSFIVGIGGGVVCDVAGFIASTYMRGIRFGFVSTTLLSQVDASVGGKNGLDLDGYKNIIGTFNQPEFVICDTALLSTLPITELRCGFAEVVKHTLIADKAMFERLEVNYHKALSLEKEIIDELVINSISIKAAIVSLDEREKGERRKLNLGHTWGHAIEKITGIPHGEAVSIGIAFTAWLSEKRGLLKSKEKERTIALLKNLGLPVSTDVSREAAVEAMLRDKKREGGNLHFVMMNGIGQVKIDNIPVDKLKECILGADH